MIEQIDHLGIAVANLEDGIAFYEKALGLTCSGTEEVKSQGVRTAFFHLKGVSIELLSPTRDDSPIAKFLEKSGEGIHHIALRTDDIEEQLSIAESAGVPAINSTPFEGAEGKLVSFLHPKSTHRVLIEPVSYTHLTLPTTPYV